MVNNVLDFKNQAEILLENRFAGRFKCVNIVEQSLLLDVAMEGLFKKSLMNDLIFKGGGALQRVYDSERFSSDVDFACGHKPKFTFNQFKEFGNDFICSFTDILKNTFDINKDNVVIHPPENTKIEGIFNPLKRNVASWTILVRIPQSMSLLNRTDLRRISAPFGKSTGRSQIVNDRQYIKIEICNVDSYLQKKLLPVKTSGVLNISFNDGLSESLEEIFYEKACALVSRSSIKLYDIFDMYFSESLANINLSKIDSTLIKNKIFDRQIIKPSLKERIFTNRQFLIQTRKNINTLLDSLSETLTFDGYKTIFPQKEALLFYARDRFERTAGVLAGKSWHDPWNGNNGPVTISNVGHEIEIENEINIEQCK